jgi:hypothetical protein
MNETEKPPLHALCPACGKMSCEHFAAELSELRARARRFADWLDRPGLDTSTRWALQDLLEAAGLPPRPAPAKATDRGTLELVAVEASRKIGRELKQSMPEGVGFAVLVFDFGGKGNLAYVSNAQRPDMLRAMREFITKNEAGGVSSVFGRPRS